MTETPTPSFIVTAEVPVAYDIIANAFVGVCEGPYSPWLHSFRVPMADDKSAALSAGISVRKGVWYAEGIYWQEGGKVEIEYDLATEPEGGNSGRMTFGMDEIKAGLARMAVSAPHHFTDLINENDDAITHDVMVQMIVFGEIIYG